MSIRLNNLGQQKEITWGVLGKRKTYKNEVFKVIEVEREKERHDWKAQLEPWSGMKKGKLTIMMPLKGAPTPPPPTNELWNEASSLWNNTSDNWETI